MKNFTKAIVRKPAMNFAQGLTTSGLGKPDYDLIIEQHKNYVNVLSSLGLKITELPVLEEFPDAYFVEDVAVVTDEVAVITNPGANERNGETEFIKETISKFRNLEFIKSPGTLDGGDVLQVENLFFIGISERTNISGAEQLGKILSSYGYSYSTIVVGKGLHLKSNVNYIGTNTLLMSGKFNELKIFEPFEKIIVDEEEQYAANSLLVNNNILVPKGFPKAKSKLEQTGKNIIQLDVSEVRKMDGGLTCLSLRFS